MRRLLAAPRPLAAQHPNRFRRRPPHRSAAGRPTRFAPGRPSRFAPGHPSRFAVGRLTRSAAGRPTRFTPGCLTRAAAVRSGRAAARRAARFAWVGIVVLAGCRAPESAIDRTEGAAGLRGLVLDGPFDAPAFTLTDTGGRPYDFRTETAGSLTFLFFGYTHCPDICPVQMAVLGAALDDLPYASRSRVKVVFVTTDPVRDTPERLREWLDRFDPSFVGLRGEGVNDVLAGFHLPPAMIEAGHGAPRAASAPRTASAHNPVAADPAGGRPPGKSAADRAASGESVSAGSPPGRQAAAEPATAEPARGKPAPGDAGGPYTVGHATPVLAITGDGIVRALYPSGVRQTDWRHDLPTLLDWNTRPPTPGEPDPSTAGAADDRGG